MTYNEYLKQFPQTEEHSRAFRMRPLVPRLTCNDGRSLSVQVSSGAYCSPRRDDADHYYEVEVGFPSERIEELMKWAETPEAPTETVYGYVPVEVVDAVIAKHGGIKTTPTPSL